MAKAKKTSAPKTLLGADEFRATDTEHDAIEKIFEARAAANAEAEADKKNGDNGGPMLDESAWLRALHEYTAEMLTMEDLTSQKAEVAGRISSIRKIAKKLKVNWGLIQRHYEEHKDIRKGGMGAMVTDERQYRWLLKLSNSPLGTQGTLWDTEPEDAERGTNGKPGMDAELQGQHAQANNEPSSNNPFTPGTDEFVSWDQGWNNAMAAQVRKMAPNGATAAH